MMHFQICKWCGYIFPVNVQISKPVHCPYCGSPNHDHRRTAQGARKVEKKK
ncbi:MAG: hypothetical protein IJ188_07810 [Clostridia bacterium]|nr:hypothetical protein [Clostridia bacterium]